MKFKPLAYAILFSLLATPVVAIAATKQPLKKPVPVAEPPKAYEPEPICGVIGNHNITIPMDYALAGAIYDADQPGDGCSHRMIIAGMYMKLQDASPAASMEVSGYSDVYLIIGAIGKPYELGARKAIDNDIVQRSMAAAAKEVIYPSTMNRKLGKLNDAHYWGHQYFYTHDASGKMTPYKICKTYRREDRSPESCEFIYQDSQLGLAFRVGFDPAAPLDYEQVRAQALQAIDKLLHKA